MSSISPAWSEKYRPSHIEDYIFQDNHQQCAFLRYIVDGRFPNIMLSGLQGTGKTSLVQLLLRECGIHDADILKINGSKDNSVDVVRNRIDNFMSLFASGPFKVVWIEEADRLTLQAQDALKDLTEPSSGDTPFIFTCNHERKLTPELKSRFQQYRFKKHPRDVVVQKMNKILNQEKIKFTPDLVDYYVDLAYPDLRKMINMLEQYSSSGSLVKCNEEAETHNIIEYVTHCVQTGNFDEIRMNIINQLDNEQWESFYRCIYENLHKCTTLTPLQIKRGITYIAEYLYRHTIIADPVINADAMLIRLSVFDTEK